MSNERTDGFTLLEVIVALAIAALALIVLFRAGSDGLFAVDTATRAEEAVERAQSHLAAIGHDVALLLGETAGDDGGGYHWRLRINPVASWPAQLADPLAPPTTTTLFDVEVAISWSGRGRDHAVVLDTRRIGATAATR
ncbi:MAG: prepilin-type N-terminal cleavage/methylation domain-containing protein [Stellaceae bacterium]